MHDEGGAEQGRQVAGSKHLGDETAANPKRLETVTRTTPRLAYLYLAVMVATWAGNWPLMRLALAHTEPMVFASLRMAGSIAVLAPILGVLRRPLLPVPTERLALFWVGLFQVTGFIVFSIIGLAIVAPGRAIVLAYTMPLWAIPLGLGLSLVWCLVNEIADSRV